MQLHDRAGKRLYLTAAERAAFMAAARRAAPEVRTLCAVLHDTGCRESEALEVTPERVDLAGGCIVFRTLKKRREGVYRAVPVPPATLDQLDLVHRVRDAVRRGKGHADAPLWPVSRMTLWPVSRVMLWHRITGVTKAAGILDGPHRCPKGPRHGYAVHAVGSGVPLNMLCRWMSHGSLKVTAIYADALGAEEQSIAAGMWGHRAKGTPFAASPFPAGPRTLA